MEQGLKTVESNLCSICFEILEDTPTISHKRLPCNHDFHEHCLGEWLRQSRSCPICRAEPIDTGLPPLVESPTLDGISEVSLAVGDDTTEGNTETRAGIPDDTCITVVRVIVAVYACSLLFVLNILSVRYILSMEFEGRRFTTLTALIVLDMCMMLILNFMIPIFRPCLRQAS